MLRLVVPNAAHEAAFLLFAEEYARCEPERWRRRYRLGTGGFAGYLAGLRASALPRRAWVRAGAPEQTFWLLDGDAMAGAARLRTELTHKEAWFDGHVGLDVLPSRRGRGLGTELLGRLCERAWVRGLPEVVFTALEVNRASCAVAARCGGELLGVVPDRDGEPLCRYRLRTVRLPMSSERTLSET